MLIPKNEKFGPLSLYQIKALLLKKISFVMQNQINDPKFSVILISLTHMLINSIGNISFLFKLLKVDAFDYY